MPLVKLAQLDFENEYLIYVIEQSLLQVFGKVIF